MEMRGDESGQRVRRDGRIGCYEGAQCATGRRHPRLQSAAACDLDERELGFAICLHPANHVIHGPGSGDSNRMREEVDGGGNRIARIGGTVDTACAAAETREADHLGSVSTHDARAILQQLDRHAASPRQSSGSDRIQHPGAAGLICRFRCEFHGPPAPRSVCQD
jgi:hypothetical protein